MYDRQLVPGGYPAQFPQGMPMPFDQFGIPEFPFSQGSIGGQGGPPTTPPPSTIPQQTQTQFQQPETYAVDPGSIRGCLYRFTYIRLRGFQSFWFFPTYIGRRSVAGYRWNGFRWTYFGVDLRRIQSFQCV